jgi:HAT1-interacting factor 1
MGDANPLNGILGKLLGESPAQQKTVIEQATKTATDLTGLVKRKRPAPAAPSGQTQIATSTGKRSMDDGNDDETRKRAKIEAKSTV